MQEIDRRFVRQVGEVSPFPPRNVSQGADWLLLSPLHVAHAAEILRPLLDLSLKSVRCTSLLFSLTLRDARRHMLVASLALKDARSETYVA